MIEPNDAFRSWLMASKQFGTRSSQDVVSRINRINRFIDLNMNEPTEYILFSLSVNPAFKRFSRSICSQLRRAVKLYKEFLTAHQGEEI